jgi:large subunit ribosomal protein L25
METVAIKGNSRSEVRTKGAKAIRAAGKIPGVVYGGDTVSHVAVDFKELRHAVYTPDFKLIDLELDGEQISCIVKDIQFHPVTEEIVHVDFLRLVPGRSIKVEVPVRFDGASPGIKEGGSLVQKMRRIAIKTTPEHLVNELVIDISDLHLGFSVRVSDAIVGEGIEVLNTPNIPVASVEIPRALKTEEEEEGIEMGDAEGGEGAAEGSEGDAEKSAES